MTPSIPRTDPMKQSDELLPCPFCGGAGLLSSGGPHEPNDWCGHCLACDYSLEFQATKAEALAAWNRRAALAEPSVPPVGGEVGDFALMLKLYGPCTYNGRTISFEQLTAALASPQQPAPAIRGGDGRGWKLVPVDLTEAMIEAYCAKLHELGFHSWVNASTVWPVLLAAAPLAPSTSGDVRGLDLSPSQECLDEIRRLEEANAVAVQGIRHMLVGGPAEGAPPPNEDTDSDAFKGAR
jgi:Lar family restriction alleviation protein